MTLKTTLLWLVTLISIASANLASAEDNQNASPPTDFVADRLELEEQITSTLYSVTVVLHFSKPGDFQTGTFSELPADTTPLSERTAFFEGCVLIVRSVNYASGVRQDERTDLAFIETDPGLVEIRPQSVEGRSGLAYSYVDFPWKPQVERRLRPLQQRAQELLEEAYTRFPSDVAARLPWLADRLDEELTDKIYLDAGTRNYHSDGTEIASPSLFRPWFSVTQELSADFVGLVHRYQSSYCGDRADA